MTSVCYWWKLLGDDHNSLCRFLDVSAEQMLSILRKCQILYGDNDSFRTTEFEKLMHRIDIDYTTYRPEGKPVHFLKIGDKVEDAHAILVPKDMYLPGGVLEEVPVSGVHLPGIRTKISRRLATSLLEGCVNHEGDANDCPQDKNKPTNKGTMTIYINDLIEAVKKELNYASRMGKNYSYTQRAERMLRKAAVIAIKGSVQDLVDA